MWRARLQEGTGVSPNTWKVALYDTPAYWREIEGNRNRSGRTFVPPTLLSGDPLQTYPHRWGNTSAEQIASYSITTRKGGHHSTRAVFPENNGFKKDIKMTRFSGRCPNSPCFGYPKLQRTCLGYRRMVGQLKFASRDQSYVLYWMWP